MTAPTPSGAARAAFRLVADACGSHPRCPRQHGVGLRAVRRLIVQLGRSPRRSGTTEPAHP